MMNYIISFIIGLGFHIVGISQVKPNTINIGTNHIINSKVLEHDRNIKIYTPKGYQENTEKSYPVLYVLDGQEYFLHGIAYQDMLRFRDKSPEFIIIGIDTDRRKRRSLFYNDSDKFIGFLENELIPYIDTNFRTKKESERILFGWEMGAGLGFEVLSEKNNLFSGFILASPSHATEKRMNGVKNLKKDSKKSNKFLLVTAAPEEYWITKDTTFLSIINKKNKESYPWRYKVLDREDHYTTPLKTIHEGLSDYFSDYKPIRLRSLKAYDDYGGLVALRAYYKKRGERYNLPINIHNETKHFLIFNALQENNYERFEYYVNEFNGYIESISRDFWLNRYAQFYLKHKNKEKALYFLNHGLKKYNNSKLLYKSIGDVYATEGNKVMAKKAYKKALSIDPNYKIVQESLNSL